ncbi:MAG: hypothetical protein U9Q63_02250 [Patescibacteria group bacterium]|nr:hypothetical protein [Patescibacteria group bacterium]
MKQDKGQSLVEVVVGVGMMSLLLVALLALISLSVKNSRVAKNKTQSVALAQEGIELMRTYRDYSWNEFSGDANGSEYILDSNWTVGDGLNGGCTSESEMYSGSLFSRCVNLSGEVDVTVTVYWQEGPKLNSTVQTTKLTRWER